MNGGSPGSISRSTASSNPLNGLSSSGSGGLTLTRVVRSTLDPTGSFDLIGDGSGAMGDLCIGTSGSTSTGGAGDTGPSTCTCVYDYIRSTGAHETPEAPTTYRERDLIRCSSSVIPADVTSVSVSVHLTNSGSFSNQILINLRSMGVTLDLSSADSFVKIQRYQCRDTPYIGFQLDGHIYDPIQSDDPTIAYPLDFYTNNMGGTIAAYVGLGFANSVNGVGWYCPPRPNDPSEGFDLTVYSVDADVGGSKQIFPPNTSVFDRSTFFLARQASGVFTVPVNAVAAPNTVTGSTDLPSLGYGAAPTPLAGGVGETCPDASVTIPSGYQWVKVWLFRGSLEDRKVRTSAKIAAAGTIACNPGTWSDGTEIFKDCDSNGGPKGGVTSAGGTLADRVLKTNVCVNLSRTSQTGLDTVLCQDQVSDSGAGCTTFATGPNQGQQKTFSNSSYDFSLFAKGTDVWSLRQGDPSIACGAPGNVDPLLLCDPQYTANPVPHDPSPTIESLDGGISRYDYLFVVSPTNIMSEDFQQANWKSLPYTPYRFYSPIFCQSPNPDAPLTPGDCASNRIIRYGFKQHDVTTNGDAPAGDPGRLPVFPVCALQKI